jgi:hypothetical protein
MRDKGAGCFTSRDGPGPGNYEQKTMFEKITGSATFGRDRRVDKDQIAKSGSVPGPGQYSGNYNVSKRNVSNMVFGTASRD